MVSRDTGVPGNPVQRMGGPSTREYSVRWEGTHECEEACPPAAGSVRTSFSQRRGWQGQPEWARLRYRMRGWALFMEEQVQTVSLENKTRKQVLA